ncbi:MAG: response regulator [Acetatifactor sp.]|jgi:Response regulator containing a CheY-like receiver domain and an HTH DNA-binding domain|nr:response regulator [Acetatifactor sp.]MDE7044379.1 response regulator [Acetatifactor sp.]
MKYKVLLTGNNKTIINEFFTYMDLNFECISTSDRYDDIMSHMKYVQPDVFVYCLYKERPDDLKRFVNIERQISDRDVPLVIIGDSEDCDEFTKIAPLLEPLVLQKPISTQNIATAITNLLNARRRRNNPNSVSEEETLRSAKDMLSQVEEAKVNARENTKGENRKNHILIVDDDSRVLRLLKSYLSGRYELATAINGNVALKFLEKKETDLVLLDYEMPTENGAAVLEKIRANEKTKDLPVVFLTGVTEKSKIREVLALKPQGYLLKPVDMEKLSSTIKGILG